MPLANFVPLANLKEALTEVWVKHRCEKEEQGAVGGEEQHAGEPDKAVEVWKWKRKISRWKLCV